MALFVPVGFSSVGHLWNTLPTGVTHTTSTWGIHYARLINSGGTDYFYMKGVKTDTVGQVISPTSGAHVYAWQINGTESYAYDNLNRGKFNGDAGAHNAENDIVLCSFHYTRAYDLPTGYEFAEIFILDDLSVEMDGNTVTGGDYKVIADYLSTKYDIS
jgi:hypothetical protein